MYMFCVTFLQQTNNTFRIKLLHLHISAPGSIILFSSIVSFTPFAPRYNWHNSMSQYWRQCILNLSRRTSFQDWRRLTVIILSVDNGWIKISWTSTVCHMMYFMYLYLHTYNYISNWRNFFISLFDDFASDTLKHHSKTIMLQYSFYIINIWINHFLPM